ncbi:hypothetical protein [Acinetobacter venetianus]|uniref:hypothetical protein n=1 Tax=Acinetobacter venetianus TaxID=52133 RepID=UPI00241DC896|nr:hypothetical protein [Acinetobacter venetianus]
MHLNRIRPRLDKIYNEMITAENFKFIENHESKLAAIFLGEAGKIFEVPYEVSGNIGVYTYHHLQKQFFEIDLKLAPKFIDKDLFIDWFAVQIKEGFDNLEK